MTDVRGLLGEWRAASQAPLGERLAAALETALLDGRLPLAVPLPSERALAAAVGVSRATVSEAYGSLRARGWLETRQGARGRPVLPAALEEGLAPRQGRGDVVDLTLAAPAAPAGAFLDALDAARRRLGSHLATTGLPGAGLPELRAAIAARHGAAPEEILVTTGAMAGLHLVLGALLPVRAPALAELPSYPGALDLLRDRGRPLVGWPRGERWDLDRFEALVARRGVQVAYVVADFHNPTGRCASAIERGALSAAAERLGVLLIADETMRELDLRERPRPEPPLRAAVTVSSLSKVLWGGLRVGWVRAPRATVEQLARHPLAAALAPPPLDQLLATELLGDLDALVARRRATLRARRDHLVARLAELDGIEAAAPPGGLSVWAALEHASSARLATEAARRGVLVAPGGRFSPDTPLDRHLRIPFALPEAELDRGLARLAPLLRAA